MKNIKIMLTIIIFQILLCCCNNSKIEECKECKNTQSVEISHSSRKWSSIETNLPVGIVIDGDAEFTNPSINWLTIQKPDGTLVLIKNIDSMYWTAIKNGDIIE